MGVIPAYMVHRLTALSDKPTAIPSKTAWNDKAMHVNRSRTNDEEKCGTSALWEWVEWLDTADWSDESLSPNV